MKLKISSHFLFTTCLLLILHKTNSSPTGEKSEATTNQPKALDDAPGTTVLPVIFEKQEEFEGPATGAPPPGPEEGGPTEPSTGVDEESDEDEAQSATQPPTVTTTKRPKRPINLAGNFNQEFNLVSGGEKGIVRAGNEDDEDEESSTDKVPSSNVTEQVGNKAVPKPVKNSGNKAPAPVATDTDFNKEWAIVTGDKNNAIGNVQEQERVQTTTESESSATQQPKEEDEDDSQEESQTQNVISITASSTLRPTNYNTTNFQKEWAVVTGEQVLSDGQARAACECGKIPFSVPGGGVNEWPWTAAVVKNGLFAGGRPHCGATLINSKYVVTAASCMDGLLPDRAEVWLTVHDNLQNSGSSSGTLKLAVEKILMHPNYHRNSGENDIALVGLTETVPIGQNNYFVPACVPAGNNDYSGIMGKMAAWGTSNFGSSNNRIGNNRLCKADMPILSNEVCNRDTRHSGKITGNMLCAGLLTAKGDNNCVSDAGGGLVISNGGRHTLVGVTAFGYTPNRAYSPTVHTRISAYPEWILHNTLDADWCE